MRDVFVSFSVSSRIQDKDLPYVYSLKKIWYTYIIYYYRRDCKRFSKKERVSLKNLPCKYTIFSVILCAFCLKKGDFCQINHVFAVCCVRLRQNESFFMNNTACLFYQRLQTEQGCARGNYVVHNAHLFAFQ